MIWASETTRLRQSKALSQPYGVVRRILKRPGFNVEFLCAAKRINLQACLRWADPGFFLGGGALVVCSTSTPINHIVFFFLAEYQLYQKTAGHLRGGVHPLHPPPRSAPERNTIRSIQVSGKLPTYPSPKPTLSLSSHLGQNVGLGEGQAGNFSEN